MGSNERINVGVIGLGVGESHLKNYLSNPRCKVIGICDQNDEVLTVAKNKYPGLTYYSNASELLFNDQIDAVSIASYDHNHYEQIVTGIRNRKHLLVEKPIVTEKDHFLHIKELLEKNSDLIFTSNLVLRKTERFLDLKNRFLNGDFGQISFINAAYNYGRFSKLTDGWRNEIENYSVILGGGIHLIDLILWLTGDHIVKVFAKSNRIHGKDTGFLYDDLVTATMEMQSGAIFNLTCNFGNVSPHFHQLEIYGTNQSFMNRYDYAEIFKKRDVKNGNFRYIDAKPEFPTYDGSEKVYSTYKNSDKGSFIDDFINAIDGKPSNLVTRDEMFEAIKIAFAIDESRKIKQEISLKI